MPFLSDIDNQIFDQKLLQEKIMPKEKEVKTAANKVEFLITP